MKSVFMVFLLSVFAIACEKSGSSSSDKKVKLVPVTSSSSQFAQDVAGKKWCGLGTVYIDETENGYRDIYEFKKTGEVKYSLVRESSMKIVESEKAAWKATETTITLYNSKHKETMRASVQGDQLTFIEELEGEEYIRTFELCEQ